MTHLRPLAVLAVLALTACPAPPGETAGPLTSDTTTTSTSSLSMSATSTDATTTTSTSTSTTSTTDTSATTDTGCSFLGCETSDTIPCLVEGGKLRCTYECDPWTQDCPEGQKCAPWANDGGNAWNATKCVDVAPNPGKPGDACTAEGSGVSGVDTCEKAALCWEVDKDTLMGHCVGFCTGSPESPMCPAGSHCTIANDGELILCLPDCDPLLQDCPGTDLCIPNPNSDDFVCVLDASGDGGALNDPCEFANACDPGLTCRDPALASECDPMASGCCLPFCDLTMPECTNKGATCLPWYEMGMAPPGYEDVGICGLML